jgi:anti-sigma regulatory factor (Ser/Thr protein kinase)
MSGAAMDAAIGVNPSDQPENLKQKLDSISIDAFLANHVTSPGSLKPLDFRGVGLVTPGALIQVAAVCDAYSRNGTRPVLIADDGSVTRYLYRSGFARALNGSIAIQPALSLGTAQWLDHMRGSNPMLLEVTRVENGLALPDLLDQIYRVLRYRLKYRKYDALDVTTAVSEICQNAFDHNAGTSGFVAMQVYGKGPRRFLEIAVSDCGEGLLTTLRRNPRNAGIVTDLGAIREAMKLGISEHEDRTRGTGLFHLLAITYKHGGTVQVKSGRSKVRYRTDKQAGWAFPVTPIPGVHVALTLPTKTAA